MEEVLSVREEEGGQEMKKRPQDGAAASSLWVLTAILTATRIAYASIEYYGNKKKLVKSTLYSTGYNPKSAQNHIRIVEVSGSNPLCSTKRPKDEHLLLQRRVCGNGVVLRKKDRVFRSKA